MVNVSGMRLSGKEETRQIAFRAQQPAIVPVLMSNIEHQTTYTKV